MEEATETASARSSGISWENKTWATFVSKSQSVVRSLLAKLLLSLATLWHSFHSLLLLGLPIAGSVNNSKVTICEEEEQNPNDFKAEEAVEEEVLQDKMTIEVAHSEISTLDQGKPLSEKVSIPPAALKMRLNSESLESDEGINLEDYSRERSCSAPDDLCSGYCSGSGSSLPASPVPPSTLPLMKQNQINLLSGDEDEGLPQEGRRDSDTSDGSEVGGEISPEVVARIISQVESMFSDDHLAKDGFLLKHVRRRSDGFVSLKLVAGLRKVKQISREFSVVLEAIKSSEKMEVNEEGTKIRRKDPLTPALKSMPIKTAKKDKSKQTDKENVAEQEKESKDKENPLRKRGGSLPITALQQQKRGSTAGNYLNPNASPPHTGYLRPKSNSYSEGSGPRGMSSWLQQRKASAASSRMSTGEINLNGVIRQPRGPDGTRGFHQS